MEEVNRIRFLVLTVVVGLAVLPSTFAPHETAGGACEPNTYELYFTIPTAGEYGVLTLSCKDSGGNSLLLGLWVAASGNNKPDDQDVMGKGPIPEGSWKVPLASNGGPGAARSDQVDTNADSIVDKACNQRPNRYPILQDTYAGKRGCFQIHSCRNVKWNKDTGPNPVTQKYCTLGCIALEESQAIHEYSEFKAVMKYYFPSGGTVTLRVDYPDASTAPEANINPSLPIQAEDDEEPGECTRCGDEPYCPDCEDLDCPGAGAVGGIAELPDLEALPAETTNPASTNHVASAWIAGGVLAGALILAGAAWYARRRWLR